MYKWLKEWVLRIAERFLSDEEKLEREHAKYTVESDKTLSELRLKMHCSDDPEEIAKEALKVACEFYQGDWCGILDVDMELGVWTPYWWHFVEEEDVTLQYFREYEIADYLGRWMKAFETGEPVIISDTENIKKENPEEYQVYKRLVVQSVIGIPFWKRPTGFLVVRNPKRYVNEVSFLQLLSVVMVAQINDKNAQDSEKLVVSPIEIADDKDVKVNFLGNFEIITQKGKIDESVCTPKECKVAAYMLLHRKSVLMPRQITEDLWPDDKFDSENTNNNLRGRIYDVRKTFHKISDYLLIESTKNGYRINPELNIMTDLQQFDKCWEAAKKVENSGEKIALLKQAIELYKGSVFKIASGEHWLNGIENHYRVQYLQCVRLLLEELANAKDYLGISEYATKTLCIMPENVMAYYWMVYSTYHLGAVEMAKAEVERARIEMTSEEYEKLVKDLEANKEKIPLEFKNGRVI